MKPSFIVGTALSVLLSGGNIIPTQQTTAEKKFTVSTYAIHAEGLKGLSQSLIQYGPKDQFGNNHHAYTQWDISWKIPQRSGKPQYDQASVVARISMTLPSWTQVTRLQGNEAWDRYARASISHEMNHVHAAYKVADSILAMLTALPPSTPAQTAKYLIQEKLDGLRSFDIEYDQKTRHGLTEGVTLIHQNS